MSDEQQSKSEPEPVKEISFEELITIIKCFTKGYVVKRGTSDETE